LRGSLLIVGARAVLPDRVLPVACVRIVDGKIVEISEQPLEASPGEETIQARGRWLMPGLIDLHCDAIEKELQPRPGVIVPFDLALAELDRKLALAGVTTMYHAISFGAGEGVRSNQLAAELARAITRFAQGHTLVNHRVHVRFELSNFEGLGLIAQLIEDGTAGLLSLMDHIPGQGQYRNPERFKEYVRKTYHVGEDAIDAIIEMKLEGRALVTDDRIRELAELARARGVPLAAHDLDSHGAVDGALALGVTLVEFPMYLDVARYGASQGLHNCVGAPNLVLGRSQDGNLSAREAVAADAADLICSDYLPSSVLRSVFTVADLGLAPLGDALAMSTCNAAATMGLAGVTGAIELGAAADLIVVSRESSHPTVDVTIVSGEVVLTASPRGTTPAG
jgi:alpha-D-ribose 1-methylphosphonate 5-triphosphate diphosphatase